MSGHISPLNDRRTWNFADPYPDIALDEIEHIPSRAKALIYRSQSALLHTHFVQIVGVKSILSGLDYHYNGFMEMLRRLERPPGPAFEAVRHEAVAWLNRVGQLYYFLKSKLVSDRLSDIQMSAIDAVMPFRQKHTAHRSIDAPKKEDSPASQLYQAMSMSEVGGALWYSRNGPPWQFMLPSAETHYLCFQIPLEDGGRATHVELNIELQHPLVMNEGYAVLAKLLSLQITD